MHETEASPISRREWAVVLALTVAALVLRIWNIQSAGLTHFDEGVYAFSALGLSQPGQPHLWYPTQEKFSPPLFPALLAVAFRLAGGAFDTAGLSLNAILGALTVLAVWQVGRRWLAPPAAVAASALLALSEFHIVLSRALLTDVVFALIFLVALAGCAVAIERLTIPSALAAGLLVGVAWNTKYHGWFTLLISGAALIPYVWFAGRRGLAATRPFVLVMIAAAVALACYLPWVLFVQSQPGGYAELARHQKNMLSLHWIDNLLRQIRMQVFLDGPFTRASLPVALLALLSVRGDCVRGKRWFLILALVSISAALAGGFATTAGLALAAIPLLLRRRSSFPAWLLLGWMGVWFFSTPLYRPYARLLLPLSLAMQLAAGYSLARMLLDPDAACMRFPMRRAATAALAAVAVWVLAPGRAASLWRPTRGFAAVSETWMPHIPAGGRVIVVGEPALGFYLHLAGRTAFERTENMKEIARISAPVYLATGNYARQVPVLQEGLRRLEGRLVKLAESSPGVLGDVRLLDDFLPAEARVRQAAPGRVHELTLYRLDPAP